jgi:hypothetical protein
VEELPEYESEEQRQALYNRKYRHSCKKCCKISSDERKKLVKINPTVGKAECVECKELLDSKLFFKDCEECIPCYKKKNNIEKYCKQCSKCEKILLSNDFHNDVNKPDGLHTVCKICRKEKKTESKPEIIECEFCKKEVIGKHNLKAHQNTISCKQTQGKNVSKKVNSSKSKKIQQIDKSTLKVIKEHDSIQSASEELDISRTTISKCLRGINKTGGNYLWKYV